MRLLVALLAGAVLAALAGTATAAPAPVLADVRAVGGLCARGSICMTRTLLFADGRVVRDGAVVRRVTAARVAEVRRLIAGVDIAAVRARPFTGTCPIAYDGPEMVYRLRGIATALRGCTWDLSQVPVGQAHRGLCPLVGDRHQRQIGRAHV